MSDQRNFNKSLNVVIVISAFPLKMLLRLLCKMSIVEDLVMHISLIIRPGYKINFQKSQRLN